MSAEPVSALSIDRPFPGLRPFGFADHEFFFGREEQSFELYRRLDRSRFLAVVGSSGSGKSSLVRAGLRPLLAAENAESGGRTWRWVELRPGDAPLTSLAGALAELAPGSGDADADAGRHDRFLFSLRQSRYAVREVLDTLGESAGGSLLVLVDQFEELFRYAGAPSENWREGEAHAGWREETIQFVQHLLQMARDPELQLHVMLTMRSDFIGDCARFQGLPEAVSASQFLVPSLTRDQRKQVIFGPIDKAGATIEPLLIERLLNDAGDDLDELPVLQHGLQRLWEVAQPAFGVRRNLTLAHYDMTGRLARALSRHADALLEKLAGDGLAVEQMFRAVSEIDRDGRATRRALPFAQLLAETGIEEAALRRVLDRFRADDCSFLVPPPEIVPVLKPETRIDVGHETLLRRWDKISAAPIEGVEDASFRSGWLWQEERDGQTYRTLLALLDYGRTLPLDQTEARWQWWKERPRTAAWTERYGGQIDRIEQLFADSRAALTVAREREDEIIREREAAERRTRRRRANTIRFFWSAALAALLLGTGGRLVTPSLLSGPSLASFDLYQRLAPRDEDADPPARFVDIDDKSLTQIGQWPWPRQTVGAIVDKLREAGASAIAFDILFSDSDRTSPVALALSLTRNGTPVEEALRLLKDRPDPDATLAAAIGKLPVALGFALVGRNDTGTSTNEHENKSGFAFIGDDPLLYVDSYAREISSLDSFQKAAAGSGFVNQYLDPDNLVRRAPLVLRLRNTTVDTVKPSLPAETLRLAIGVNTYIGRGRTADLVATILGRGGGLSGVRIGDLEVPTDAAGRVWLYYAPLSHDRVMSAADILSGQFDPKLVASKIIVIGSSVPGLNDLWATPIAPDVPGAEIQSQEINQILQGEYLVRPDWAITAESLFMLISGLLFLTIIRWSGRIGVIFGLMMIVGAIGCSWLMFRHLLLLIDAVYPTLILLLVYALGSISSLLAWIFAENNPSLTSAIPR